MQFRRRGSVLDAVVRPARFTTPRARLVFDAIAAELRAGAADAVLIDARDVTGPLSVLQRARFVYHAASLHLVLPMAMVAQPQLMHPTRFGQWLARRRGLTVGVFSEYTDALDWLARQAEKESHDAV